MGISIHYSGKIANKQKLPQLIEEVEEIAKVQSWKYHIYEREFEIVENSDLSNRADKQHNGKLYGIDFTPEGSEPVALCFLSNGQMSSIMQMACWGNFEKESVLISESAEFDEFGEHNCTTEEKIMDAAEYYRMLCYCSAKTQYAGSHTHKLIIGVLRYVSKNYLADFKLIDEGQFWETGDEKLLEQNLKRNGFLIDSFTDRINNEKPLTDEDIESLIKRIALQIKKKDEQ